MKKILVAALFLAVQANAQDDLMKELESSQKPEVNKVTQTFKGTRLINGQSVETKGKGELEFVFAHRFGYLNSGSYNAFGFDNGAVVRLGLEYGVSDKFGVGIGRNFYFNNKMVDLYGRYRLLTQTSGASTVPVTITAIGSILYQAFPNAPDATANNIPLPSTSDRIGYAVELPIARKFSTGLSLQVTPIFVHRNSVNQSIENNNDFATSFGGRMKITRSLSLIGEYYLWLNKSAQSPYYNSAGLGIDIETGGHVFQLIFTNSAGLNPLTTVTQTRGDVSKGDIRFGFNITRTFQLSKRK